MKSLSRFEQFFGSQPVYYLVCLISAPDVLFRLFGILYFWTTISSWALVPVIVVIILIIVWHCPLIFRRIGAIFLVCTYFISLYCYGWANMKERLADGSYPVFETFENLIVLLLALLCFMRRLISDNKK